MCLVYGVVWYVVVCVAMLFDMLRDDACYVLRLCLVCCVMFFVQMRCCLLCDVICLVFDVILFDIAGV